MKFISREIKKLYKGESPDAKTWIRYRFYLLNENSFIKKHAKIYKGRQVNVKSNLIWTQVVFVLVQFNEGQANISRVLFFFLFKFD